LQDEEDDYESMELSSYEDEIKFNMKELLNDEMEEFDDEEESNAKGEMMEEFTRRSSSFSKRISFIVKLEEKCESNFDDYY